MASTSSADDVESQFPSILASGAKEDDFQQTIELLQIDAEEVSDEISHSVAEVCDLCLYIHSIQAYETRLRLLISYFCFSLKV